MTKEQLIHIINLVKDRDWKPLYKEGCSLKGWDPYSGDLWVSSAGLNLFCCMPFLISCDRQDLDAIAQSLDSLKVKLIQAVSNDRSDDFLAASGEPEYWQHEMGSVTYYPDGSCSEVTWI